MIKYVAIIFMFTVGAINLRAQELNCQVTVIPDPSLPLTPVIKDIFMELENAIYEYMNDTRWTKDVFEIEERINCNLLITVAKWDGVGTFDGRLQIQASRPVYNTAYNTLLLNHVDEQFTIHYLRNTVLLPIQNFQYRDNLTAILSFYAYMIIGYDYDSFSLNGGEQFFRNAQQLANNAKSSGDDGWMAEDKKKRNRYWMVDNVLQSVFSPLRDCYYKYHRVGMDIMYEDIAGGRLAIVESLQLLDKIQRSRPGSLNLQMFLTAKSRELIDLYSQAEMKEKNTVVSLLKRLDPVNSSKYQEILN